MLEFKGKQNPKHQRQKGALSRIFLLLAAVIFIGAGTILPIGAQSPPGNIYQVSGASSEGVPKTLIPVGRAAGIKLFTEGVIITSFQTISHEGKNESPAEKAGLAVGDIITRVNGEQVKSNSHFSQTLAKAGSKVQLTVNRKGKILTIQVSPIRYEDGSAKIGAYVRDSMAGLGTITYFDPKTGRVGALGHGITDSDTGVVMPASNGSLMAAIITGVRKGQAGIPGELIGNFPGLRDIAILHSNTEVGITASQTDKDYFAIRKEVPVAEKNQVKEGDAIILSNISGEEVIAYRVEISKVYNLDDNDVKDMQILVKDDRLLSQTGGIVQGMSGSPILQNGRIIGAVTHVFIDDPTRGYGIYIGSMFRDLQNTSAKAA